MFSLIDTHWIKKESSDELFHKGTKNLYQEFLEWSLTNEPAYDSEKFSRSLENKTVQELDENGDFVDKTYRIFTLTKIVVSEKNRANEEFKAELTKRDKFLTETDFTQLADAPIDSTAKAEYRDYRKYLRCFPLLWENDIIVDLDCKSFEDWKLSKPTIPAEWNN